MIRNIRFAFFFTIAVVWTGAATVRAQSLKVMTFNIAHGDHGGISAHVDFIIARDPDVVVLQEVSPGQQFTYETLLEQRTTRPWDVKYQENCELGEADPDPEAPNPTCGQADGDGVAILSRLPFQDGGDQTLLWGRDEWTDARSALRVKVRVGNQDVQVFGTHLAAGGAAFEGVRTRQVNALKLWMSGFIGPRILGGDLNGVPGSGSMTALSDGYVDAWVALRPTETGASSFTHSVNSPARRIDYWWSEAGSAAQPVSVERPPYPSGALSDHYTVVAVYSFGTTLPAVPGRLQAEEFDEGGEGIAYHDTTAGNSGGQFRATDVDIEGTSDAGGGFNVGWFTASEWLQFTVNVATTGNYTLHARVASTGDGARFHVDVDDVDVTGSLAVPNTGAWQNWTTVSKSGIHLTAGQHVIRFAGDVNGTSGVIGNLNWLEFVADAAPTELLADTFDGASLDTNKWSIAVLSGFQDTNVPVTQANGHLNIGPLLTNTGGSHYNGILSDLSYDLTGASVRVQVVAAANSATGGTTSFTLPIDSLNHYRMFAEAGLLWYEKKIANVKTNFSMAFDPVQHAFWRIRHDPAANEMVFETAPNTGGEPGNWTVQRRMARELPVTAMRIELKAGTWKAETSAPGTVSFDNVLAVRP